MSSTGQALEAHGWLGFPRGAWLIIGVEFWERFSFYGMLAILALFLTATPAQGGFGWPPSQALSLLGIYSGSMYALPAIGGFLADRVIGRRRAVAVGASIMLLGQILMVASTLQLKATFMFYAALACLIAGNALMKSTLVVLCGETFAAEDPRREGAYAYYYLGISVGAMLSGAIIGVVSESFGWAFGFATAAAGMSVAVALYLLLAPRWLKNVGQKVTAEAARSSQTVLSPDSRLRFFLVFAAALLLCIYSIGWFQLFGSWALFIQHSVNRSVGSFVIPVPWFSSVNAAVVIAVAPLVAALWVRLAARGRSVDIVYKYVFALSTAALANFLMCISAAGVTGDAQSGLWAPLLGVSLLGIGEIVAWTATYGFVTRAAPAGLASMTMGAWYLLTLGLGGYLSGFAGIWIDTHGFARTFGGVAIAMAGGAIGALLLRRPMLRIASRVDVVL